ncbi:MAG TPA: hypothetical protein ENL03_01320, partial [Phycisphaerae bacterium]|nr:hypothetical protein [Phycisphaerae bacterium]
MEGGTVIDLAVGNIKSRLWVRGVIALGFILATFLVALVFLKVSEPKEKPSVLTPFEVKDNRSMLDAMMSGNVRKNLDTILDNGSRFTGQEGWVKTQYLIRDRFEKADLDVYEQHVDAVAPTTTRREILGENNQPIAGLEIYPFLPNQAQPIVTPDEGITGELVYITEKMLTTRVRFNGCIAVVNAWDMPKRMEMEWVKYAQLGFSALIVSYKNQDLKGWKEEFQELSAKLEITRKDNLSADEEKRLEELQGIINKALDKVGPKPIDWSLPAVSETISAVLADNTPVKKPEFVGWLNECLKLSTKLELSRKDDFSADEMKHFKDLENNISDAEKKIGLKGIDWSQSKIIKMISNTPVNYTRLAANREIFDHIGKKVTLHVRCKYENMQTINFLGLMKSEKKNRPKKEKELLIITSHYDAFSYMPDLAEGTMSALGLAAQLSLLEGLEEHRDRMTRDVLFISTGSRMVGVAGTVRLLGILGGSTDQEAAWRYQKDRLAEDEESLKLVDEIVKSLENEKFLVDSDVTGQLIDKFDKKTSTFFKEQGRYILDQLVLEMGEPVIKANIALKLVGDREDTPEFKNFMIVNQEQRKLQSVSSYPIIKLVGVLQQKSKQLADARRLDQEEQESEDATNPPKPTKARDLSELLNFRQLNLDRFSKLRDYHIERISRAKMAMEINKLV